MWSTLRPTTFAGSWARMLLAMLALSSGLTTTMPSPVDAITHPVQPPQTTPAHLAELDRTSSWLDRLVGEAEDEALVSHLVKRGWWRHLTHRNEARGTSGAFSETFDGNRGLERFRRGVFHRDVDVQGRGDTSGSWQGDHDLDCGPPTTSRTITKADRHDAIYACRDHLMTSMGHVDGYSLVWFSPNRIFRDQRTVSWDVNSTDLGTRQWWEVAIVPAGAPDMSCISWLPCDIPSYPAGAVVVGTRDSHIRVWSNGAERNATWETLCRSGEHSLDPEGCDSKAIRRPWSVTDNGDGTLSISFRSHRVTVPGSFPDGDFRVVFKDHSYTPLKDGPVSGFTWHWDDIAIR